VWPLHIRAHILTIFLELSYAKPETVVGSSELKSTAMFILPPFQAFNLSVLSISIAAIWGVSAKDKFFHLPANSGTTG